MASPLSDLDELVLKCRDQQAKDYIKEAVLCYKAGAFRSAIVSTWIAISFDIINKFKELALAGDKEAEIQSSYFEKARENGDIAQSLKFERDLLIHCRDKFEIISHVEFIDLERVQQDRNRCAHPSMTIDGEIFNPSAELARTHIRSTVEYLLQHPPAQGKYALESLLKEVDSAYFPTKKEKAIIVFKNSHLAKPRASLVKNFCIVLLKNFLSDSTNYPARNRIISALSAIDELHKENFRLVLSEKLTNIIKGLDDSHLYRTIPIFFHLSESWSFLEPALQHKIENYVENLPSERLEDIDDILKDKHLSIFALRRIKKISPTEFEKNIFFSLPDPIGDRMVQLYINSKSYEQANKFASFIKTYSLDFNKTQLEKLVKACYTNIEIAGSFEMGSVIASLRKNKNITSEEISTWINDTKDPETTNCDTDFS